MRTIIELPEDQLADLDAHCRREHISRAEAIRRAVTDMLASRASAHASTAFGLWRGREKALRSNSARLKREWE
jgi:metal-responsive CopG/Arc/MetJ family transcriptional regulator